MVKAKWLMVAIVACVALAAVMVGCAARQANPTTLQVVRAQRFELVDAQGRVRIDLGMGVDGSTPCVRLLDGQDQPRIRLSLRPDGIPALTLLGEKGETRAELSLGADGGPILGLGDEKGQPRAVLRVTADGSSILGLFDDKGKGGAGLAVLSDGRASLGLSDDKGKVIWRAP